MVFVIVVIREGLRESHMHRFDSMEIESALNVNDTSRFAHRCRGRVERGQGNTGVFGTLHGAIPIVNHKLHIIAYSYQIVKQEGWVGARAAASPPQKLKR